MSSDQVFTLLSGVAQTLTLLGVALAFWIRQKAESQRIRNMIAENDALTRKAKDDAESAVKEARIAAGLAAEVHEAIVNGSSKLKPK